MNAFDLTVIAFVNQFSQHSWAFDRAVLFLSGCSLLKGGVLVTLIWWAWFNPVEDQFHKRQQIISTLLSCLVAMVIARGLALSLPFRYRPVYEAQLDFLPPYGMEKAMLKFEGWSSFPSDHAVLFFALSTGLYCIARKVGIFALTYTSLLIAMPRIYLGLHYPTDILAGAALGIGICLLGNAYFLKSGRVSFIMNWVAAKPEYFFPVFFIFTYQIADMFDQVRWIFKACHQAIESII